MEDFSERFEDVFLPQLDAAYNLARWILLHDQDAEDCVQEAYLRAYKAYSRFRGNERKAWFMTIVRNVCYTQISKRQGQVPEPFDEELHYSKEDVTKSAEFSQKALAETLQRGLARLPTEYREIIVLHDLESQTYKEISVILGIPIGTVMSRLSRARTRLRNEVIALVKEDK